MTASSGQTGGGPASLPSLVERLRLVLSARIAHALEDQNLHRSLTDIRLQLPGLTMDTATFRSEVEFLRRMGGRGKPSQQ